MKTIEIKHRDTDAVLCSTEVADDDPNPLRTALGGANLGGANLEGANLGGAYLDGANLEGANLDGANLARADLEGANLGGANLARANLGGANLDGADLVGAYLGGANLEGANLVSADLVSADLGGAYLVGANLARANLYGANLVGANLARANLDGAYLANANLDGAYLANANGLPPGIEAKDPPVPYHMTVAATLAERAQRFRERHPDVPVVERLDARILEIVESGQGKLRMSNWHTCDTTHCRGGWAISLAAAPGRELERKIGTPRAAQLIYMASTGRIPHFYATDEDAMADLRASAAAQPAVAEPTP